MSNDAPVESGTSTAMYLPISPLGAGGMAQVDLALRLWPGTPRPVALKHARVDERASDNAKALIAEALIAARLVHPNIVTVLDLGHWNGRRVVELEYVEGASFAQLLRRVASRDLRLAESVVLRVMSDVLAGLHHAHSIRDRDGRPAPIIHRDVSSGNILVGIDGRARLIDFGVAKTETLSTDTPVGFVKGNARYMAPEQVRGQPLDCRADIFACGVVLWEALAGRKLDIHPGYSLAVGAERVPRVSSVTFVPRRLDDVVARCLEPSPAARFSSADELRVALRECAQERGGLASAATVSAVVEDAQGEAIRGRRRAIDRELALRPIAVVEPPQTRPRKRPPTRVALAAFAAISALAGAALTLLR